MPENIYNKLKNRLESHKNKAFAVVLNNKPLFEGDLPGGKPNSKSIVRLMYRRNGSSENLLMGIYTSKDGEPVFQNNDEGFYYLQDKLCETEIFGVDLDDYINTTNYIIHLDTELKIVFIESEVYSRAKNTITDVGTDPISVKLRLNSTHYFIESYIDLCQHLFLKKITGQRAFSLRFYNWKGIFVPILIESKYLFNPFFRHPEIKRSFVETNLFKVCHQTIVEFSSLRIYYATQLELCKGLNFKKSIPLDLLFPLQILAGVYDLTFPNVSQRIYVRNANKEFAEYPDTISVNDFPRVLERYPFLRDEYTSVTTLYRLCMLYYRRFGYKSVDALYDDVINARIV